MRGMMIFLFGVAIGAGGMFVSRTYHIVRADDGKAAVWVGAIDDLWRLGRATGVGGPWQDTAVEAGKPSDPYLFAGYDARRIALSHGGADAVNMAIELDLTGNGLWIPYKTIAVPAGQKIDQAMQEAGKKVDAAVTAASDAVTTAGVKVEAAAQQAGEKIEAGAKQAGEAVNQAVDATGKAVEKTGKEIQEAAKK